MTTRPPIADHDLHGVWDAVVIGAGLAGAAASYQLAQRGRRVLLVEAKPFPRGKVCGGCLNARAIDVFQKLGLGGLLEEAGAAPYERMQLHAGGRSLVMPIPQGLAVTRQTIDQLLVDAAVGAGIRFVDGTPALVHPASSGDSRTVRLGSPHDPNATTVHARVVLACDGLGRPSLTDLREMQPQVSNNSRIGLGAVLPASALRKLRPADALQMVVGRDGYVGFSLCEEGRISVAAAIDRRALTDGAKPAKVIAGILKQAGVAPEEALDQASWRGTRPLSQRCGTVAAHRLLLVGDAAGYVEPFTGEGMAAALEGSLLAGRIADQAIDRWSPRIASQWQSTYTRAVRSRQRACSRLAWLLRRPRLTRLAMRLVERWPSLGVRAAQRISSPAERHKEIAGWAHR